MALLVLVTGCRLPGTYVTQNPDDCNRGMRYYRSKPYLLVLPHRSIIGKGDKAEVQPPSQQYVTITLEYLPDFAEEYAVEVVPGLGKASKVNVTLEEGWNLTKIGGEFDARFAENVGAVSELGQVLMGATAGADLGKGMDRTSRSMAEENEIVIEAQNVPLGYYEAVIGKDRCGKRRMYGWRYVGFAPFNACPTDMHGLTAADCHDQNGLLYGLVFRKDVMVFEPLNAIGPANPARVSELSEELHQQQVAPRIVKLVERELTDALRQPVRASVSGNTVLVRISPASNESKDQLTARENRTRTAAEELLGPDWLVVVKVEP